MSDFADVERFGRQHAACGRITSSRTQRTEGDFRLTLTCACGATFMRRLTAEEATQPLPLPSPSAGSAPVARSAARTSATPSVDLEAALRAAVEAEEPAPAYQAPPPPRPDPAPPASPPARWSPPKLNLDTTIRTALDEHAAATVAKPAARPSTRAVWLVLFGIVALGAAAGIYLVADFETVPVTPIASAPSPPPPPDPQEYAALADAVKSLRQLQAASSPGMTLSVYSSRVIFAKTDVERALASAGPGPGRTGLREVLDIHLLAESAWKARSLDQKDVLEAVGQDPTLELCPSAKRVVDFAAQPAKGARGVAVASAIPLLWECAAEKLAALERDFAH